MLKGDHVHRTIFWNSSNEIAPVFCGSLSATIWAASLSEICAVLMKQMANAGRGHLFAQGRQNALEVRGRNLSTVRLRTATSADATARPSERASERAG
jgi:hypothetical protein